MFTLLKHYLLGPIWEAAENLPRALCSLSPLCSSCHRCVFWDGQGLGHSEQRLRKAEISCLLWTAHLDTILQALDVHIVLVLHS